MAAIAEVPVSGGYVATINADDLNRDLWCETRRAGLRFELRISSRKWYLDRRDHTDYAFTTIWVEGKQHTIFLHRLVMCARQDDMIDHVDGNGLNNVRTNLRFTTDAMNQHNRAASRTGSSKYKGVTLHKQTGKWEAHIRHERKKRHLGLFALEVDAAAAYDKAASELFGTRALLNFDLAKESA
jgi:hypothetical protein